MLRKRTVLINALVSLVQVIVNGLIFLVLYRFLFQSIGADDVGVWSVVLAWTSVGHIANLGLAGSTVKYVSMYLAREDRNRVALIIETSLLSIGLFIALVLFGLYPLIQGVLPFFIEPAAKLPDALSILPYTLISFWFTAIAGVLQSSLDGFQRIELRSIIGIATVVVYLILAITLVPEHGLIGLAWAQLGQAALLTIGCWIALKYLLDKLALFPLRWNREVFKEMLSYSLNIQFMSIVRMLFEPTTKALISRFGGVSAAGYFEAANKLVMQLRALVVTAHQAMVPAIADLQERDPSLLESIYKKSFRLILFFLIPTLPLFIALTPFFSFIIIGSEELTFVLYADLLFIGWFLNLLSNPAYFANLGTGRLRGNVIGELTMSFCNAVLGVLLGWQFGGFGVVVGFVTGLLIGSAVVMITHHIENRISLDGLISRETLVLGVACILGFISTLLLRYGFASSWHLINRTLLMVGVYLVIIIIPLWTHSARHQIGLWVFDLVLRKKSESPSVRLP